MKLSLGKMFDEWFDEHRGLALANKWRCRCYHGLCPAALHRPEEERGELFYEPLKDPIVKAELDKGHEEYNCLFDHQVSKRF